MGFIILVTCYQVGYWTRHYCIWTWQMSQEIEKELHYWECEHDFFISQSCIKLSKDFLFACSFTRVMLPGGKKSAQAFKRPSPSCLHRQLALAERWRRFFFFFSPPQAPSSVRYLRRLLYREEGGEKKRNLLPIAALIPKLLRFSFSPSSKGSFPPKCLAKQKRCFAFAWKTNHSFTKLGNKC